ncbi:MAG: nitrile hydratase subunit beta [Actinomycetota bacterium]|jgi:nitrile hydratase subunit beta|nr:nitrile hydratase subunit beta [Actinomycetota bacterium]
MTAESTGPTAPIHDLGGAPGYGAIPYMKDEPPFHEEWERKVYGIMGQSLAASAQRPGEFRHALERLAPADYFDQGYYGRWEAGFELILEEYGVIERGAVDARLGAPTGTGPASRARQVIERDPSSFPPDGPAGRPRFAVGDSVWAPTAPDDGGHTRLPGFVVAKRGRVVRLHPIEPLPDSTAHDLGSRPQQVYCVEYDGAELWGDDAEPGVKCYVDLYEPYISALEEQQ